MPSRDGHTSHALRTIALLCQESRLRRILQVTLRADGHRVTAWDPTADLPACAALVLDLDSLDCRPGEAATVLRAWHVPSALPLLLLSVWPAAPRDLQRAGPVVYLQPPFGLRELSQQVAALLRQVGAPAPGSEV